MSDLPKISKPAIRALESVGITSLEQVADHTEKELLALHGFGPKGIRILKPVLAERGLSFAKPET